jgi:hypothetical protein
MTTMKIPKSLFETIQGICKMEARRLCREAAVLLDRPENELIEKVLQSQPQTILEIIEDANISVSCPILIQKEKIYERCRRPCILGTERCLRHQSIHTLCEPNVPVQTMTRIETTMTDNQHLWCDETTSFVYDSNSKIVGTYKNECLELFVFEDTQAEAEAEAEADAEAEK